MCTRPIRIKNNNRLKDSSSPRYFIVSCGKCPECRKKLSDSYILRGWYERIKCQELWSNYKDFFLTFTYNQENVPFYIEDTFEPLFDSNGNPLFDEENKPIFNYSRPIQKKSYCSDFSDVQKMLKLLRSKLKCPIRYFCCTEFGEKRGRIHYHMILMVDSPLPEAAILDIIQYQCWCRFEKRNNPDTGYLETFNLGPLGEVHNERIKRDKSIRTDYNCFRYVCKYVTKCRYSSPLGGSQSLRIRCSLGFGLGPNHEVPFTSDQLERGFVFLPFDLTNRFYIPNIYYNAHSLSYDEIAKNASYGDYAHYINSLIYDNFFSLAYNSPLPHAVEDVRLDLDIYLKSKRFSSPWLLDVQFNKLCNTHDFLIHQIPNLFLSPLFNERTRYNLYSISNKYTYDDLMDFMLYVAPYLHRTRDGLLVYFGDSERCYKDVVFLYNCLTKFIKSQQKQNSKLQALHEKDDEAKSNYFNSLYYEKLYLSKVGEHQRRDVVPVKCRCSSLRSRRAENSSKHFTSCYCPF